jgi:DNA-binding NarL/FixJ family response regulator
VGEAADGPQAVALAEELKPDVITMDVSLPGMNGIDATRAIVNKMPQARIIGLSMHIDSGVAEAMRGAGAVAYLTKGGPSEDLLAAIRACRAG